MSTPDPRGEDLPPSEGDLPAETTPPGPGDPPGGAGRPDEAAVPEGARPYVGYNPRMAPYRREDGAAAIDPGPRKRNLRVWVVVNTIAMLAVVGLIYHSVEHGEGSAPVGAGPSVAPVATSAMTGHATGSASASASASASPAGPPVPTKAQVMAAPGRFFGVAAPHVPQVNGATSRWSSRSAPRRT